VKLLTKRLACPAGDVFGRRPKTAGGTPALLMALNNPKAGLWHAATNALMKIDPEAAAKAGVK
jgi:hypothetical protein